MEFETAGSGFDLFAEADGGGVVAFAGYADVEREGVAGLKHLAGVVYAWGAGRC